MSTTDRDAALDRLTELERDYAAGQLTDDEYRSLHDDFTLQAAELLREEEPPQPSFTDAEQSTTSRSVKPTLGRKHTALLGVGAFVVVCIVVLGFAISSRTGDDGVTGGSAQTVDQLLAAAQKETSDGKMFDAVKTYDKALQKDPNNVEALTYRGWLVRLAGLPAKGMESIDKAIAVQPNYPDAHFFKGYILLRDRNDPKAAIPEFETFLADNPPQDMVPLVQQALADARALAAQPPTTAG